ASEQAGVAPPDADYLERAPEGVTHDGPDGGIHPRRISAAGEQSDPSHGSRRRQRAPAVGGVTPSARAKRAAVSSNAPSSSSRAVSQRPPPRTKRGRSRRFEVSVCWV